MHKLGIWELMQKSYSASHAQCSKYLKGNQYLHFIYEKLRFRKVKWPFQSHIFNGQEWLLHSFIHWKSLSRVQCQSCPGYTSEYKRMPGLQGVAVCWAVQTSMRRGSNKGNHYTSLWLLRRDRRHWGGEHQGWELHFSVQGAKNAPSWRMKD